MKKILSYVVSFWYRISRPFQPTIITSGSPSIRYWRDRLPWDGEDSIHGEMKTTYGIRGFKNGTFHFEVTCDTPKEGSKNVCPWFLNLEEGMVQEIDVAEFMHGSVYFGVYWNDKRNYYFDELGEPEYKKFQVKYRGISEGVFSVTWNEKRVKWYYNGKPMAVCYHLPITQKVYLILSGLDKGNIILV